VAATAPVQPEPAAECCFHCGAPLPPGHALMADAGGSQCRVCSEACRETVAEITGKGLGDFYRFREAATEPGHAAGEARWAIYDRPALQQSFVSASAGRTRTAHLLLTGVRCAACAWLIERAMTGVPGVTDLTINPVTARLDVTWNPARLALSEIMSRIARLGYTPYPHTEDAAEQSARRERRKSLQRLIVAGLGMMQVATFAVALYAGAWQTMDPAIERFLRLVSLIVATPVVLYAGAPFFAAAWRDLKARSPGMDVPVALAIGGAYTASVWNTFIGAGEVYFDSATMFVFLLSIARYLEMAGRHRVLGLTDALASHLPRVATLLHDDGPREVGVVELRPGDRVLVRPGESFPADGIVEDGEIRVDESLLTGESVPVRKCAGDTIVAGSINQHTAATIRIERTGADTVIAEITRLMTAAGNERPPAAQLADRVARRFVGGVLLAAVFVGLAWWNIDPARAFGIVLAVLVVTCPCALALATPAAFTVATSALARRGFMLRRPAALEIFDRVTDIVFDKTGTLTDCDSVLGKIHAHSGFSAGDALRIATALEAHSEHPLARAFRPEGPLPPVTEVRNFPGQGLQGVVDGEAWRIGTASFAAGLATQGPEELPQDRDVRAVCLGGAAGIVAEFEIGESLRPGAAAIVEALKRRGVRPAIVSGDQPGPVSRLAARLGIGAWRAGSRPEQKLGHVREWQADGRIVAMVGDGINDSPVLAGADVSVAMGSGTSLAQHSADCVVMTSDLATIVDAFDTARRTMRVVRQNLLWAIAYNIVALPLAALGFLAPWMAAIGMSASSLLVTMNALRLGRGSHTVAGKAEMACCNAARAESAH